MYTYVDNYIFDGVCLTTVTLPSSLGEVGLAAAALAPLCVDMPLVVLSSARSLLCTGNTTILPQSHPRLHLKTQGEANGGVPREPKGGESDAKESPLGGLGSTKRLKGSQKQSQRRPKESKMSTKDTQRKPTNQKTIYTLTKYADSRSTAIQRRTRIFIKRYLHMQA